MHGNSYEFHDAAHTFFEDAQNALQLSKSLSQNGYLTAPFLEGVLDEMERAKSQLLHYPGATE